MEFFAPRALFLKPLQMIMGLVDRRHTLPILSNVLCKTEHNKCVLIGTDLEIELVCEFELAEQPMGFSVAMPGRKFLDICRGLPEEAVLEIALEDSEKITVKSGRSRFVLYGALAQSFPVVQSSLTEESLSIPSRSLSSLLRKGSLAMAESNTRHFLNGTFLSLSEEGKLRSVSTDGHRLATSEISLSGEFKKRELILPKKMVTELIRLCDQVDETVQLVFGANHLRAVFSNFMVTSKLMDAKYPDYRRVLPTQMAKVMKINRDVFRNALSLVSVLSHEKYRAVRLRFSENALVLSANNPHQEQAEHQVEAEYSGEPFEIAFNIIYLQEVLSVLPEGELVFSISDIRNSALLHSAGPVDSLYVIMPIRL